MRRQVRQVALAAAALLLAGAAAAAPPTPERVDKPEYTVGLAGSGDVRPYVPVLLAVELQARGGFHVNQDYPSSFRVTPAAAEVRYPRARVDQSSGLAYVPCAAKPADACGMKLIVPFFAEKTGLYSVGGTLRFSVCDDERCLIEKVDLGRQVVVR